MIFRLSFIAVWCASSSTLFAHGFIRSYSDDPLTTSQYQTIWDDLTSVFGDAMPEQIEIQKFNSPNGTSRFNPTTMPVSIQIDAKGFNYPYLFREVIAHESAHLGQFNLSATNQSIPTDDGRRIPIGFSLFNQFRFVDEGFANILGHEASSTSETYRTRALTLATLALHENNVSFHKVENWKKLPSFEGEPGIFNPNEPAYLDLEYSYEVGSSFVYYLESIGGRPALHDFLREAGKTKNLAAALAIVYPNQLDPTPALAKQRAEARWKAYIQNQHLPIKAPRMRTSIPENDSIHPTCNIDEMIIQFDQAMDINLIAIDTSKVEKFGISSQNARWITEDSLALFLRNPSLPANTEFEIGLGYQDGTQKWPLRSKTGIPFPVTSWRFSCADHQ